MEPVDDDVSTDAKRKYQDSKDESETEDQSDEGEGDA